MGILHSFILLFLKIIFAFYRKPDQIGFALNAHFFQDIFPVGIYGTFPDKQQVGYFLGCFPLTN